MVFANMPNIALWLFLCLLTMSRLLCQVWKAEKKLPVATCDDKVTIQNCSVVTKVTYGSCRSYGTSRFNCCGKFTWIRCLAVSLSVCVNVLNCI